MREFNSILVPKDRLLLGIHGLRGLAALAVVLFHLIHIGGIKPRSAFGFIGRDFGYSVHLFFILSAFSLMYSTEPRINRPNWIPGYFVKRFFRIAPLYFFVIAFQIARQLVESGSIINDFHSILLEITFTFGFVPFSNFCLGRVTGGRRNGFLCHFPGAYFDNSNMPISSHASCH